MEFEYNFLRQLAHAVAHRMQYTSILSICTTSLQGQTRSFSKKFFPVHHSLFSKLLRTCFSSIQEPFSHCCLLVFRDTKKKTSCGPAVSCSSSVLSHNQIFNRVHRACLCNNLIKWTRLTSNLKNSVSCKVKT